MPDALHFTDNEEANRLLASNPVATMIGMLLDQQFPMERAFFSPYLLQERLGEPLTAEAIAALDDARVEEIFRGPPALHRYPVSMGKRARDMCRQIVDDYDGDAASIWETAADGSDLYQRLRALPGFGEAKTRVFIAIVGKRLGAAPDGWEAEAADWLTIADVDAFEKIAELREYKQAKKAKKAKS
jgi:uncharacterized HhH-GPD family protein